MPFIRVFINPTTQPGDIFPTQIDIRDAILIPHTLLPLEIGALTPHDCLLVFRVLSTVVRENSRTDKSREFTLQETSILEQLMPRIREGGYYPLPSETVLTVSRQGGGATPYLDEDGMDPEETRRAREMCFTSDWEMAESAIRSAGVEEMVELGRMLYSRAQGREQRHVENPRIFYP